MNAKHKTITIFFGLLLLSLTANIKVRAQKVFNSPPAVVYETVDGKVDISDKQNFQIGKNQPVQLKPQTSTSKFWLIVSSGYTVDLALKYSDNTGFGFSYHAGKYNISYGSVAVSSVVSVAKNYFPNKVTLFSDKNFSGAAFDYPVGIYTASSGALNYVGGDNAVSSVFVPIGMWVRFCENEPPAKNPGKCETFTEKGGNLN